MMKQQAKINHQKRARQESAEGSSVFLWIALLLSLALNVFLIVKEFISK